MIKMTETITKLEVFPKEDTKRRTLEAEFIREGQTLFKISGYYNEKENSVEVTETTGTGSNCTGITVSSDFIDGVLKSAATLCRKYKCFDYEYSLKLK